MGIIVWCVLCNNASYSKYDIMVSLGTRSLSVCPGIDYFSIYLELAIEAHHKTCKM